MTGERTIIAVDLEGAEQSAGQVAGATARPADDAWLTQPVVAPGDELQRGTATAPRDRELFTGRRMGNVVAGLALAAWTGFFVWAHFPEMTGIADPGVWAGWVSSWATPALLIGVGWLMLMQSGRRVTNRFIGTSRLLADETERLEACLLSNNRELSLAREFVSAQARDLDAVGRIAVDRLSHHAERLQSLVQDNRVQIETISTVSAAALDNMERLRGQLPVLTSAAKDVTNNFGTAGRAASAQLEDLIAGFDRLSEAAQGSEMLVGALRSQFDQVVDSFSARTVELDQAIHARAQAMAGQAEHFRGVLIDQQGEFDAQLRARMTALTGEIADTRGRLDQEETASITSLRSRLRSLRDESTAIARALRDAEDAAQGSWREAVSRLDQDMRSAGDAADQIGRLAAATSNARMARLAEEAAALERVLSETGARVETETTRRRHAGEAQDRATVERLAAQLAAVDAEIARREVAHTAHLAKLASHGEAATRLLATLENRIADIAAAGGVAEVGMARRLDVLGDRLGEGRKLLDETDATLNRVTARSMRLSELIAGAATLCREDLALAIGQGVAELSDLEERALTLREVVIDADRSGASLAAYLLLAHDRLSEATTAISGLHDDIHNRSQLHAVELDGLAQSVIQLDTLTGAAAARVQGELLGAIRQLESAAGGAVEQIERRGAASVATLAAQLGTDSGVAIERAMRLQVAEISGKLEQAAAHAAGISREATWQLREQLGKVDELVGNLETRVDHARARAEERVDDGFARRVALITEALNSNAIDIAKALDTDVSDTAWSAYLRGDRGIFTRRAVRLLDPPEARGIVLLYQNDATFRDHVSQYIHDFEAMLRQLLSTRDGRALGVTLLSSDMGKLYVALAQAIERLRN